jgi:segregation and condensation protein A
MSRVLEALGEAPFVEFQQLFTLEEGRRGVVVTFLAILEMLKGHLIDLVQQEPYAPIYLSLAGKAQEEDVDESLLKTDF